MHRGRDHYARIYTQDSGLTGSRYIHSQPVLPWHVNRDYDWLISAPVPEKVKQLSWVTSSKTRFKGHRDRMGFLSRIRGSLQFDLYGRGFLEIADKWDGLAPYRYSLAIENYSNPWYWTEKIADCFLTWTMPIYYGCNEISHYFPSESYIQIDIHDPSAIDQVREIISSDLWDNSLGAIHEARKAVLNRHQIFPFLVNEIRENETQIYRIGRRPTQTEVKISTNSLAQRIKKMGLALPRWSHRIMKDLIDSA